LGIDDDPYLCAIFQTARGVGELYQRRSTFLCYRFLCRPTPHQDWGQARIAGGRLARDDKELGPQLEGTITRTTAS